MRGGWRGAQGPFFFFFSGAEIPTKYLARSKQTIHTNKNIDTL